jgi:hypothetical protein
MLRIIMTALMVVSLGSSLLTGTARAAIGGDWTTQADSLRGKNGQRFTYTFPGAGVISGRLWGSDTYTDDSSIATAAVHAGLISPESGGTVTIEIRPGAPSYRGSTRHGVTSKDYGSWHGSFVFVDARPPHHRPSPMHAAIAGDWNTQADSQRGKNGQRLTYTFPGGGVISGRLWGSDTYTDDSSIATAAVHAGLISPESGGTVTIEIRPGAPSYQGSTRHGVTSKDYGSWHGSFVFVDARPPHHRPSPMHAAIAGDWNTQADSQRGKNGQRLTYTFPGGGVISGRLWGSDTYTDDSSIATAAVHAGLISPESGGTVTIEIRPGAPSYQGSTRHGVTSKDYGSWHGSFVFVDR